MMTKIEFNTYLSEEENKQAQFKSGKDCYERGNYEEAIDLLREPAMQDHVEAKFYLGRAYTQQKFYSHAIRWLTKAAKEKHPEAQYYLGEAYFYGKGVVLDYARALELYKLADEQGNKEARESLRNDSDKIKQLSTTEEYAKNVKLSRLANQGNLGAKYDLAIAFYGGKGVLDKPTWAIELWREAAELGHAKSQYSLGVEYSKEYSKFIPKDPEEALKLFQKAAEQGHIDAQYRLGKHYYDKNEKPTAVGWWEKAADKGHSEAQYRLGNIYYEGIKDDADLNIVDSDKEKAFEFWKQAAVQEHLTAQYNLGIAYKNGLGVTKDCHEALQWLRKVAEHNKKMIR